MRRILQFIRENQHSLVFIILMLISIRMYTKRSLFFSKRVNAWSIAVNGQVSAVSSEFVNYFNLAKEIQRVTDNNKTLLERLPNSFVPVEQGLAIINDTLFEQEFSYTVAEVVNNEVNQSTNFIIIKGGEIAGHKVGQGVCTAQGIVGVVAETTRNFTKVKSVLSVDFNAPVFLQNTGYYGYMKWRGHDPRETHVLGISRDVDIKEGDTLQSFGTAYQFPKGLPVGTVVSVSKEPDNAQQEIIIRLSEDIRSLQSVLVVNNLMQDQIDQLLKEDEQ